MQRIIIGISGASGAIYAIRLLQWLDQTADIESHLVISKSAHQTLKLECPEWPLAEVKRLAKVNYSENNVAASIASGSYPCLGMVIIPTSMKTVAQMAHGTGESLLHRAADVTLKERRKLIVVPREAPLHLGHLRNLTTLAELGAIIIPPLISFYHRPQSLAEVVDHTIGKVLEALGIRHELYNPWSGPNDG